MPAPHPAPRSGFASTCVCELQPTITGEVHREGGAGKLAEGRRRTPDRGDRAGRSIWPIEEYGPSAYGDRFADIYDERLEVLGLDTEGAVAFLAE
jgi:hypothetical protein